MEIGMVFDVAHGSYVDGPGVRTTVFFKGCNLKCKWCHNPESQSPVPMMLFYKNKCIGCRSCSEVCPKEFNSCDLCGKCTLYCPTGARRICGKEYTANEILSEIIKDKPYYENSGGGVTFSGGECMLQIDFLCELLRLCKENGLHTAVDTAGCVPFESFEKILPYTDLFLYDIKTMDLQKHIEYTGVDNTVILNNLKRLLDVSAKIWIRIPIISGINDSVEEMIEIKSFFDKHGFPEKVELLSYHSLGESKYEACGKETRCFKAPDLKKLQQLKDIFA